ncbi:MAG: PilX N-terminal domain-containing pilus assembly protein [Gammaproteobacteria bacterium]|nr:PilX N-terminal domain-containing pilus assembly protein [Gammaproteobacteria bacterium]MDH3561762.1 PilX N-terminal domain-containing pilus assembly protein [Gammaproteobacteria bacterium]
MNLSHQPSHMNQQGAILMMSLMMLMLLTIIGITAMNTVTMEERMAGNLRDSNLAFQGAEAALRDGESQLEALTTEPTLCSSTPCDMWEKDTLPFHLEDESVSWWVTNAKEYGVDGTPELLSNNSDPRMLVEFLQFSRDNLTVGHGTTTGRGFFRVTARSEGGSDASIAILQTTFVKRLN